jgi:hypothetical protein
LNRSTRIESAACQGGVANAVDAAQSVATAAIRIAAVAVAVRCCPALGRIGLA